MQNHRLYRPVSCFIVCFTVLVSQIHAQDIENESKIEKLESQVVNLREKRNELDSQINAINEELKALKIVPPKAIDNRDTGMPVYTKIQDGELRIEPTQKMVYLLKDSRPSIYLSGIIEFLQIEYKCNGKMNQQYRPQWHNKETTQTDTAGYFEINNRPARIVITSESPEIATVSRKDDGSHIYTFIAGGIAHFAVKINEITTSVRVPVVELPISKGMAAGDVIDTIGLPTRKATHYISWPDSTWKDRILYSPEAGHGISAIHYEYDKFPFAAIAIVDGSTTDVGYSENAYENSELDYAEYTQWRDSPVRK